MPSKSLCIFASLLFASVASAQSVPRSSHVWMITEENHSYEEVVGNPQMPYYNQLIQQYGLATQFYAEQHSSLPALMWLVAGAPVERNNDTKSCHHHEDNIVREVLQQGYTWRAYQENMPYAGFDGLFSTDYLYYRRHNPLIDFSDVCPGSGQEMNSVPFWQMAADFADNNTPNYAYITPGPDTDAHNGTLPAADQWLQDNVPAILARPEFSPGGDGILFIVWDEGNLYTDDRCSATKKKGCGGRTATLVLGPRVKPGYQSTVTYQNANVLSTVCAAMGLAHCPGAAKDADPMSDFFTTGSGSGDASNSVVISSPGNGATIDGSVRLLATASESETVSQTQVWDNGVKLGVYGTNIDTIYNLAPGQHSTTVLDLDASGSVLHQASVAYTVRAQADGVQVVSPAPGETVNMATVHVVGHASESQPVTQVQVWDNGVKLGWYAGADVNQYYSLSPGSHVVTVLDLDSNYNIIHLSNVPYSVQ
ncbi:alkaline phosphatase family protein [Occallatibacter riparius]|uniref:Ig-like domain-containing protein n=1 Tax=Occallatibacter riparius TaxID=1002689 RepID=A0A9J7BS30_9BACT|nr:alkaline phosphatase family protein [Occallatibacter riparius]UWZ85472.1 Ig-like domain-containing protein [Occallatibacter riparius]